MQLEIEEAGNGVTVARLIGRLDIPGAQAIDLRFNVMVGSKRAIVLDLSELSYVASMGLRTLIMGARTVASKKGKMVIASPNEEVLGVLQSSGVDALLPILASRDEAVSAVAA